MPADITIFTTEFDLVLLDAVTVLRNTTGRDVTIRIVGEPVDNSIADPVAVHVDGGSFEFNEEID